MIFYMFLYVFLIRVLSSDNLKSFEADKGIEFLPPTKSEKNRSSKGQIFRACSPTGTSLNLHISQLALPATWTFRNMCLFYWEFESPNCRYTLCVYSLWYCRFTKGSFNWTFFLFLSLILKSSGYTKRHFLYFIIFSEIR